MSRFAIIMICLIALSPGALSTGAMAGDPRPLRSPATAAFVVEQAGDQTLGRDIVKARVMSGPEKDAQSIGLIEDLLFDRDGRLVAALVGVGGFLGIGEKTVAVSWAALIRSREPASPITFVTTLTRAQLEQAPAFVSADAQKVAAQKRELLEKMKQQSPAGAVAAPSAAN
jgi:hypothetical protein